MNQTGSRRNHGSGSSSSLGVGKRPSWLLAPGPGPLFHPLASPPSRRPAGRWTLRQGEPSRPDGCAAAGAWCLGPALSGEPPRPLAKRNRGSSEPCPPPGPSRPPLCLPCLSLVEVQRGGQSCSLRVAGPREPASASCHPPPSPDRQAGRAPREFLSWRLPPIPAPWSAQPRVSQGLKALKG